MTQIDTDTLAGLHETLGGVTVPNIMHGDNLAITLCTAYDNPDQDADETGWTPDALAGQEAVLAAIRDHYDPAIKCAIALRAQAAKDKARIERLEAALRPFADYMHQDGGRLDADSLGRPIPDGDGVGWIYLTHGDFRRARAALEDA